MFQVPGFLFSTAPSEQKNWTRDDIALILSVEEANVAAMYTRNAVKAAPVVLSSERTAGGTARAIIVNSGNANACTGIDGYRDAEKTAEMMAGALEINQDDVLVASTGVIGKKLNMTGIERAVPILKASLDASGLTGVARAIMTTDTVPKMSRYRGIMEDKPFIVCGVGKGVGMMRPDMATMLVFLMTDLAVSSDVLREVLKTSVDRSFHRINIDGDTSTNDTVFAMSSGYAKNEMITNGSSTEADSIQRAFNFVTDELARMMVMDAEGATKFVEIMVLGAADDLQAKRVANIVAESKLVKTAIFGQDANWGRIIAAVGRSGVDLEPRDIGISIDGVPLVESGLWLGQKAEEDASDKMKQRKFSMTIDLKRGAGQAVVYTSDLSLDYVRINADYRT